MCNIQRASWRLLFTAAIPCAMMLFFGCHSQDAVRVTDLADDGLAAIPSALLYIQAEDRFVVETSLKRADETDLYPANLPVLTRLPDGELVIGVYPPRESQLRPPGMPPPVWDIPTMIRYEDGDWIAVRVPGNLFTDGTVTTSYAAKAKFYDTMTWEERPQYRVRVDSAIFPKWLLQRHNKLQVQRKDQ